MLNQKLHIFKGLRLFFPLCKYFYSLCEVLLSQCSVKVGVKVKIMAKSAFLGFFITPKLEVHLYRTNLRSASIVLPSQQIVKKNRGFEMHTFYFTDCITKYLFSFKHQDRQRDT